MAEPIDPKILERMREGALRRAREAGRAKACGALNDARQHLDLATVTHVVASNPDWFARVDRIMNDVIELSLEIERARLPE